MIGISRNTSFKPEIRSTHRSHVGVRSKFLMIAYGDKTAKNAARLAEHLYSYLVHLASSETRPERFLKFARRRILHVHYFCCKVAHVTNKYNIDEFLKKALVTYVMLELNVLRKPDRGEGKEQGEESRKELTERVLRLLWMIYSKYYFYLTKRMDRTGVWEMIWRFLREELPSNVPEYFNVIFDDIKKLLPPQPKHPELPYFTEKCYKSKRIDNSADPFYTECRSQGIEINLASGQDGTEKADSEHEDDNSKRRHSKRRQIYRHNSDDIIDLTADDVPTSDSVISHEPVANNDVPQYGDVLNQARSLLSAVSQLTGRKGVTIRLIGDRVEIDTTQPGSPIEPNWRGDYEEPANANCDNEPLSDKLQLIFRGEDKQPACKTNDSETCLDPKQKSIKASCEKITQNVLQIQQSEPVIHHSKTSFVDRAEDFPIAQPPKAIQSSFDANSPLTLDSSDNDDDFACKDSLQVTEKTSDKPQLCVKDNAQITTSLSQSTRDADKYPFNEVTASKEEGLSLPSDSSNNDPLFCQDYVTNKSQCDNSHITALSVDANSPLSLVLPKNVDLSSESSENLVEGKSQIPASKEQQHSEVSAVAEDQFSDDDNAEITASEKQSSGVVSSITQSIVTAQPPKAIQSSFDANSAARTPLILDSSDNVDDLACEDALQITEKTSDKPQLCVKDNAQITTSLSQSTGDADKYLCNEVTASKEDIRRGPSGSSNNDHLFCQGYVTNKSQCDNSQITALSESTVDANSPLSLVLPKSVDLSSQGSGNLDEYKSQIPASKEQQHSEVSAIAEDQFGDEDNADASENQSSGVVSSITQSIVHTNLTYEDPLQIKIAPANKATIDDQCCDNSQINTSKEHPVEVAALEELVNLTVNNETKNLFGDDYNSKEQQSNVVPYLSCLVNDTLQKLVNSTATVAGRPQTSNNQFGESDNSEQPPEAVSSVPKSTVDVVPAVNTSQIIGELVNLPPNTTDGASINDAESAEPHNLHSSVTQASFSLGSDEITGKLVDLISKSPISDTTSNDQLGNEDNAAKEILQSPIDLTSASHHPSEVVPSNANSSNNDKHIHSSLSSETLQLMSSLEEILGMPSGSQSSIPGLKGSLQEQSPDAAVEEITGFSCANTAKPTEECEDTSQICLEDTDLNSLLKTPQQPASEKQNEATVPDFAAITNSFANISLHQALEDKQTDNGLPREEDSGIPVNMPEQSSREIELEDNSQIIKTKCDNQTSVENPIENTIEVANLSEIICSEISGVDLNAPSTVSLPPSQISPSNSAVEAKDQIDAGNFNAPHAADKQVGDKLFQDNNVEISAKYLETPSGLTAATSSQCEGDSQQSKDLAIEDTIVQVSRENNSHITPEITTAFLDLLEQSPEHKKESKIDREVKEKFDNQKTPKASRRKLKKSLKIGENNLHVTAETPECAFESNLHLKMENLPTNTSKFSPQEPAPNKEPTHSIARILQKSPAEVKNATVPNQLYCNQVSGEEPEQSINDQDKAQMIAEVTKASPHKLKKSPRKSPQSRAGNTLSSEDIAQITAALPKPSPSMSRKSSRKSGSAKQQAASQLPRGDILQRPSESENLYTEACIANDDNSEITRAANISEESDSLIAADVVNSKQTESSTACGGTEELKDLAVNLLTQTPPVPSQSHDNSEIIIDQQPPSEHNANIPQIIEEGSDLSLAVLDEPLFEEHENQFPAEVKNATVPNQLYCNQVSGGEPEQSINDQDKAQMIKEVTKASPHKLKYPRKSPQSPVKKRAGNKLSSEDIAQITAALPKPSPSISRKSSRKSGSAEQQAASQLPRGDILQRPSESENLYTEASIANDDNSEIIRAANISEESDSLITADVVNAKQTESSTACEGTEELKDLAVNILTQSPSVPSQDHDNSEIIIAQQPPSEHNANIPQVIEEAVLDETLTCENCVDNSQRFEEHENQSPEFPADDATSYHMADHTTIFQCEYNLQIGAEIVLTAHDSHLTEEPENATVENAMPQEASVEQLISNEYSELGQPIASQECIVEGTYPVPTTEDISNRSLDEKEQKADIYNFTDELEEDGQSKLTANFASLNRAEKMLPATPNETTTNNKSITILSDVLLKPSRSKASIREPLRKTKKAKRRIKWCSVNVEDQSSVNNPGDVEDPLLLPVDDVQSLGPEEKGVEAVSATSTIGCSNEDDFRNMHDGEMVVYVPGFPRYTRNQVAILKDDAREHGGPKGDRIAKTRNSCDKASDDILNVREIGSGQLHDVCYVRLSNHYAEPQNVGLNMSKNTGGVLDSQPCPKNKLMELADIALGQGGSETADESEVTRIEDAVPKYPNKKSKPLISSTPVQYKTKAQLKCLGNHSDDDEKPLADRLLKKDTTSESAKSYSSKKTHASTPVSGSPHKVGPKSTAYKKEKSPSRKSPVKSEGSKQKRSSKDTKRKKPKDSEPTYTSKLRPRSRTSSEKEKASEETVTVAATPKPRSRRSSTASKESGLKPQKTLKQSLEKNIADVSLIDSESTNKVAKAAKQSIEKSVKGIVESPSENNKTPKAVKEVITPTTVITEGSPTKLAFATVPLKKRSLEFLGKTDPHLVRTTKRLEERQKVKETVGEEKADVFQPTTEESTTGTDSLLDDLPLAQLKSVSDDKEISVPTQLCKGKDEFPVNTVTKESDKNLCELSSGSTATQINPEKERGVPVYSSKTSVSGYSTQSSVPVYSSEPSVSISTSECSTSVYPSEPLVSVSSTEASVLSYPNEAGQSSKFEDASNVELIDSNKTSAISENKEEIELPLKVGQQEIISAVPKVQDILNSEIEINRDALLTENNTQLHVSYENNTSIVEVTPASDSDGDLIIDESVDKIAEESENQLKTNEDSGSEIEMKQKYPAKRNKRTIHQSSAEGDLHTPNKKPDDRERNRGTKRARSETKKSEPTNKKLKKDKESKNTPGENIASEQPLTSDVKKAKKQEISSRSKELNKPVEDQNHNSRNVELKNKKQKDNNDKTKRDFTDKNKKFKDELGRNEKPGGKQKDKSDAKNEPNKTKSQNTAECKIKVPDKDKQPGDELKRSKKSKNKPKEKPEKINDQSRNKPESTDSKDKTKESRRGERASSRQKEKTNDEGNIEGNKAISKKQKEIDSFKMDTEKDKIKQTKNERIEGSKVHSKNQKETNSLKMDIEEDKIKQTKNDTIEEGKGLSKNQKETDSLKMDAKKEKMKQTKNKNIEESKAISKNQKEIDSYKMDTEEDKIKQNVDGNKAVSKRQKDSLKMDTEKDKIKQTKNESIEGSKVHSKNQKETNSLKMDIEEDKITQTKNETIEEGKGHSKNQKETDSLKMDAKKDKIKQTRNKNVEESKAILKNQKETNSLKMDTEEDKIKQNVDGNKDVSKKQKEIDSLKMDTEKDKIKQTKNESIEGSKVHSKNQKETNSLKMDIEEDKITQTKNETIEEGKGYSKNQKETDSLKMDAKKDKIKQTRNKNVEESKAILKNQKETNSLKMDTEQDKIKQTKNEIIKGSKVHSKNQKETDSLKMDTEKDEIKQTKNEIIEGSKVNSENQTETDSLKTDTEKDKIKQTKNENIEGSTVHSENQKETDSFKMDTKKDKIKQTKSEDIEVNEAASKNKKQTDLHKMETEGDKIRKQTKNENIEGSKVHSENQKETDSLKMDTKKDKIKHTKSEDIEVNKASSKNKKQTDSHKMETEGDKSKQTEKENIEGNKVHSENQKETDSLKMDTKKDKIKHTKSEDIEVNKAGSKNKKQTDSHKMETEGDKSKQTENENIEGNKVHSENQKETDSLKMDIERDEIKETKSEDIEGNKAVSKNQRMDTEKDEIKQTKNETIEGNKVHSNNLKETDSLKMDIEKNKIKQIKSEDIEGNKTDSHKIDTEKGTSKTRKSSSNKPETIKKSDTKNPPKTALDISPTKKDAEIEKIPSKRASIKSPRKSVTFEDKLEQKSDQEDCKPTLMETDAPISDPIKANMAEKELYDYIDSMLDLAKKQTNKKRKLSEIEEPGPLKTETLTKQMPSPSKRKRRLSSTKSISKQTDSLTAFIKEQLQPSENIPMDLEQAANDMPIKPDYVEPPALIFTNNSAASTPSALEQQHYEFFEFAGRTETVVTTPFESQDIFDLPFNDVVTISSSQFQKTKVQYQYHTPKYEDNTNDCISIPSTSEAFTGPIESDGKNPKFGDHSYADGVEALETFQKLHTSNTLDTAISQSKESPVSGRSPTVVIESNNVETTFQYTSIADQGFRSSPIQTSQNPQLGPVYQSDPNNCVNSVPSTRCQTPLCQAIPVNTSQNSMDSMISGPLESDRVLYPFTLSMGVPDSSSISGPLDSQSHLDDSLLDASLDLFCSQSELNEYPDIKSLDYYFPAEPTATATFEIPDIEPSPETKKKDVVVKPVKKVKAPAKKLDFSLKRNSPRNRVKPQTLSSSGAKPACQSPDLDQLLSPKDDIRNLTRARRPTNYPSEEGKGTARSHAINLDTSAKDGATPDSPSAERELDAFDRLKLEPTNPAFKTQEMRLPTLDAHPEKPSATVRILESRQATRAFQQALKASKPPDEIPELDVFDRLKLEPTNRAFKAQFRNVGVQKRKDVKKEPVSCSPPRETPQMVGVKKHKDVKKEPVSCSPPRETTQMVQFPDDGNEGQYDWLQKITSKFGQIIYPPASSFGT